jgi:hypothetical protein
VNLESPESEVATAVSLATTTSASFGQSVPVQPKEGEGGGSGDEPPVPAPEAKAAPEASSGPSWQGHVLGTDEAIERFDRAHPDLSQPSRPEPQQQEKTQERGHSSSPDRFEAIGDPAREIYPVGCVKRSADAPFARLGTCGGSALRLTHPTKEQCDYSAALALAATVAGEFYFRSSHHASRSRRLFPLLRERWETTGKTQQAPA